MPTSASQGEMKSLWIRMEVGVENKHDSQIGNFLSGGLTLGERHLRITRDEGTVTLCHGTVTQLLSRFWSFLIKGGDVAFA